MSEISLDRLHSSCKHKSSAVGKCANQTAAPRKADVKHVKEKAERFDLDSRNIRLVTLRGTENAFLQTRLVLRLNSSSSCFPSLVTLQFPERLSGVSRLLAIPIATLLASSVPYLR